MTKTAENAPTELQPNSFEHKLNVYLKSVTAKRNDSEKQDQLNLEIKLRVIDGKDFDKVLSLITGGKHGAQEWLESAVEYVSSVNFDTKFKDHAAVFRASHLTIATLPDVVLSGFSINIADMGITFQIKAKGISGGEPVGKLSEFLQRTIRLEVARGKHWASNIENQQQDLAIPEVKDTPEVKDAKAKAKVAADKKNQELLENKKKEREETAAAGVCPCCNRTFKQLAAHMKNKHPDYPKADSKK